VKEQGAKRRISRAGRRRMGEAGFKNLAQYKARINTRVQELEAEVSAFRAGLLRDAGANLSASKLGLLEAAVSTYTGVLKLRHALIHSRRRDVGELSERVSFLAGNLCRILKTMGLDSRPRPRSLRDVFPEKDARNVETERSKASILSESRGKPA